MHAWNAPNLHISRHIAPRHKCEARRLTLQLHSHRRRRPLQILHRLTQHRALCTGWGGSVRGETTHVVIPATWWTLGPPTTRLERELAAGLQHLPLQVLRKRALLAAHLRVRAAVHGACAVRVPQRVQLEEQAAVPVWPTEAQVCVAVGGGKHREAVHQVVQVHVKALPECAVWRRVAEVPEHLGYADTRAVRAVGKGGCRVWRVPRPGWARNARTSFRKWAHPCMTRASSDA